jgi:hypothetical protein
VNGRGHPFSSKAPKLPRKHFYNRITYLEWLAALGLFIGSALVVIWQNSHLAVLWDLSYVLDNSYRIALGQVPYRDFPFVHAPMTFLVQALLIKLGGRVFWHHVAYCAVVSGLTTVLTWRILRAVLSETNQSRLLSLILTLPLIPLGIYSIFPHPFYDPDCTGAVLIAIYLLQKIDRRPPGSLLSLCAGAMLVIPLFVKQNTGLAFLLGAVVMISILIAIDLLRRQSLRKYVFVLAGAALGMVLGLLLIQTTAGLANYWHWTIRFAAERRTPSTGEMLGIYGDPKILIWLALIVAGVIVYRLNRQNNLWLSGLSVALISATFVWPTVYLLLDPDASERADRLLGIWPVVILVAFAIAAITLKRRRGVSLILPFIVIAAIHGAFMSQQLWGSTYAIWPLLMILLATILVELSAFAKHNVRHSLVLVSVIVSASLLIAGGFYVRSHERLSYANLDDGELKRSSLAQLKGLSTRGDWIPDFEELVQYANLRIPPEAAVLLLPGEDPFFYTTGRSPVFPVTLFDRTVNPYSPEEILKICRDRKIDWVIVKQELQNEEDQVDAEKEQITETLEEDFEQVESLNNYEVYHRKAPDEDDSR